MTDPVGSKRVVSLRRADWRFLLPGPRTEAFQHLVLLGGPSELATCLVEVGFAHRVSCSVPMERLADAVVVLHDAPVGAVTGAIGCLLPGGVFYYEVDRRRRGSVSRTPHYVLRSLLARGLTPAGLYWAAPDFDHCNRYLPLDVPGVIEWYLATLYTAGTLGQRLLETALHVSIGPNSQRFAAFAPCFSVTAVAGTADNLAPSILAHPELPSQLQRPRLRPLLLTSGQDDASRVIVMPFDPGNPRPIAVLKVARRAEFNSNTEREQVALAEIRSYLAPSLRHTIPQPLGMFSYGRLCVGVESYAAGRSLLVSGLRWPARQRHQIDNLRLAATWLSNFHQQTQTYRVQWNDAEIARWIESSVAAYTEAFGITTAESFLFLRIRHLARSLVGASLPIVWQHNDFGPWNIYCGDQTLVVIDWEFGDRQQERFGPALCDLLYFVTYWIYMIRRLSGEMAELHGFRALFCEPDRDEVVVAAHAAIADYMNSIDLNPRFLPLLLVYTWVQRALDRFERQQMLNELGAHNRTGNRYVRLVSLLAEHADQFLEAT